jgi:hypothetical protein
VKAELSKLGEAPRAYIEKIKPPTDEQMNDDATAALNLMALSSNSSSTGRMAIAERFEKIQGARPGRNPNEDGGKTLRLLPRPKQNARSRRYNR